MTTADDARTTLLALRLRGSASTGDLAALTASMAPAVDELTVLLQRLDLAGLVEEGAGDPPRWRLTDDGRAEGERLLRVELDATGRRAEVEAAYGAFLGLNGPLLRACTDWQLRSADPAAVVVNDHTDADHDRSVLERVVAIHAAVVPLADALTSVLDRFGRYPALLTSAIGRLESGDIGALDDGPSSYHGAWFELHEDLIATLGKDRSLEPLPDTSGDLPPDRRPPPP